MRVLHVYKTYYPNSTGGCEQVIKTLTQYTASYGCQNTLVTVSPQEAVVTHTDLDVYYYPTTIELSSCPFSFKLLKAFKHHAKQADILHFHFPWPFADALYLLANVATPTIITYHSDIVRQRMLKPLYHPVMKLFFSKVKRIVLTSQNYLNSSTDIKPFLDKCQVIPLGICKQDYPPPNPERVAYWRNIFGDNFFLFIGVLRSYKGLHYLIEAIAPTNATLILIGAGIEETKLINNSKHLNNIKFTGQVSEEDKIALISLCRAVVLPSHLRSEAFGICLLEGLIYGKPLISTELNTGTSFVNQHNHTGLVVPPANVQALREAILCLHDNETLAKTMGENGKQHYQKHFTAKSMAEQYYDVYQAALNS